RKALELQKQALTRFPADVKLRAGFGTTYRNLAKTHRRKGNLFEARKAYRRAQEVHERLVDDFPRLPVYHKELAETLQGLFLALEDSTPVTEARPGIERAVRHAAKAHQLDPKAGDCRVALASSLFNLARLLLSQRDHREAFPRVVRFGEVAEWPMDFVSAAGLAADCVPLAERDAALPETER